MIIGPWASNHEELTAELQQGTITDSASLRCVKSEITMNLLQKRWLNPGLAEYQVNLRVLSLTENLNLDMNEALS